jgi:hypothetical protein
MIGTMIGIMIGTMIGITIAITIMMMIDGCGALTLINGYETANQLI